MSTLLYTNKVIQKESTLLAPVPISASRLITMGIGHTITNGSCSASITGSSVYAVITPHERDPALDMTFDCYGIDSSGVGDQGVLTATGSILGEWINVYVAADSFSTALTILGSYNSGVISSGSFDVLITLKPDDDFIPFATPTRLNWIKWSDIGSLDFTIGKDNVAGERPLDWKGQVYSVRKLQNKVVAYGENGVSLLIPSGTSFGLSTIYRVGLKGKHAVTGDESKHFFVNNAGQLWKISEGMTLLDYAEYLSELSSSIVMSYDKLNNLVYICDGSVGYVYDAAIGSLGKCSPNITGIDYQSGVQYVTASTTIATDPFEICTDIYDLETRAGKTIFSLEFGTDVLTDLYAAIDWRRNKAASFVQTPWYKVSPSGIVNITAYGREFRFRAKTLTYEYFELDYIKVNGVANAY